ncbi:MAG: bifunctional precorrin-2 dehydrogenase/sirohydrochlorin ferrochelatase [bacterium]
MPEKKKNITLPISYKLTGRKCLVIGSGNVAVRKIKVLLENGAKVKIVTTSASPELTDLAEKENIKVIKDEFSTKHLDGVALVFVTGKYKKAKDFIIKACRKKNIPVNIADDPDLSDFFMPAIISKHPISIAVGTSGVSPLFARWLKTKLNGVLGDRLAELLDALNEYRRKALREMDYGERKVFWNEVYDKILDRLQLGDKFHIEKIEKKMDSIYERIKKE